LFTQSSNRIDLIDVASADLTFAEGERDLA